MLQLSLSAKRLVFSESDDAGVNDQKIGKIRSTAQSAKRKDSGPMTKMAKQNLKFS